MSAKTLLFPNGYRTTSDRLSRIKVFPQRSASLTRVYVEVFEMGNSVYRGLVDLDEVEIANATPNRSHKTENMDNDRHSTDIGA